MLAGRWLQGLLDFDSRFDHVVALQVCNASHPVEDQHHGAVLSFEHPTDAFMQHFLLPSTLKAKVLPLH